jgi:cyclase
VNRRSVLAAGAGLLAARLARAGGVQPQTPVADAAPKPFLEWSVVAPQAWVATGYGGNSLVLKGAAGVLLVDCKNSPFGAVLRREAGEVAGAPVDRVLNTHHHADHSGGNHAMKGLPLIAHAAAGPRIRAQMNRYISQMKEATASLKDTAGPAADRVKDEALALYRRVTQLSADDFAPTIAAGDGHEIDLGGVKGVLRHFGAGHTDNDLVLHVPALNLVHTGDLVFNGRHPFVDVGAGADTRSWCRSLEGVLALCDEKTVVVPGHGAVGGRGVLSAQIDYFNRMRAVVEGAIKSGKDRADVAAMRPNGFEGLGGTPGMTLGAIHDELTKPGG